MIELFGKIFSTIFGGNSWLATMLISMFPIIELKGAIPVGMSVEFWGANALSEKEAFLFSLLGSCLIVPIIALVFKPIINYLKNTKCFQKIANAIMEKIKKSSSKVDIKTKKKSTNPKVKTALKMLGIFLFIADPFPFTGVWTGTCLGVVCGLKFWQVVLTSILGNIVAGVLVTFVCSIFPQFTTILFFVVLAIILIMLMVWIIKLSAKKINNKIKE